ncbi:MAG TPA: neutral/alkaline non-lysosomal ceramidase N-terminal domain-containing protein [Patescibacteria group bacterium]|nr:neutral/alkaline non-lysosomal ceramidase N-terminal domain-containing protein [Patescibacteria group bacterium]
MTTLQRRASLFLLGLVAAAFAACVACLDTVDYRPYVHEAYYRVTTSRLSLVSKTNTMAQGELEAGFGRALLSPKLGTVDDPPTGKFKSLPLAGYGSRHGKPAEGIHDDLYVKAVALRIKDHLGIMVAADALIIPPEVTDLAMQRLARESRLSREQVYLSATHAHSSLGGWGRGMVAEAFAGGFRPGARNWFADRIVSAVQQALADLRPASIGQGQLAIPEFVRNRVIGDLGRVDPWFSYMLLKQRSGQSALLGSYSAHATVLSGDVMQFSADYPGSWERRVEEVTGGLAMFLAGPVGSTSPVPPEKGFAGAERMGRALAERILEQTNQLSLTNFVGFSMLGLEVDLPPTNVRLTDGIRLRPWIAEKVLPVRRTTFLQTFRLGETIWISTPCDFSGELALGIEDSLRRNGMKAVITSFNGDYIGYVIPLKYYHLPGYEPRTMSFFGPNVPDFFDELIRRMAAMQARE